VVLDLCMPAGAGGDGGRGEDGSGAAAQHPRLERQVGVQVHVDAGICTHAASKGCAWMLDPSERICDLFVTVCERNRQWVFGKGGEGVKMQGGWCPEQDPPCQEMECLSMQSVVQQVVFVTTPPVTFD
jgi:hypothetical protein